VQASGVFVCCCRMHGAREAASKCCAQLGCTSCPFSVCWTAGTCMYILCSCAHSSGVVMCLDLRFNLPAGFTICSEIQIDIDQGVMLGYCLCSYVIDR
jgi:hypothetical protein